MSAEEVGAYMLLLCYQWDKGALPDNDKELLRISRTRSRVLAVVKAKFEAGDDGLLRNARLEREREKQESYRKQKSESGIKGNEKRWGHQRKAVAEVSQSEKKFVAADRSSSSISFSTSTSTPDESDYVNKKTRVGNKDFEKNAAELMWLHFEQGITELMMGPFRTLRLGDVMAEVSRQCPTGTIFTNEQHLLNKFKYIANRMLHTPKSKPDKNRKHDYSQYKRQ